MSRYDPTQKESEVLSTPPKSEAVPIGKPASEGEKDSEGASIVKSKIDEQPVSTFCNLQGKALVEFRQSVKKVELPMFTGEDPTSWISRAGVYLRVQDTNPEVRVSLANYVWRAQPYTSSIPYSTMKRN